MNDIWLCWLWPIAAGRAWLGFWFGAAPSHASHPPLWDDDPPCADHDLFA